MAKAECKQCGEPTTKEGTHLCDGCWAVDSLLDGYLKAVKWQRLLELKGKINKEIQRRMIEDK